MQPSCSVNSTIAYTPPVYDSSLERMGRKRAGEDWPSHAGP